MHTILKSTHEFRAPSEPQVQTPKSWKLDPVADNQNAISNNAERISENRTAIAEHDDRLEDHQNQLSTHADKIETLNHEMVDHEDRITKTESEMISHADRISSTELETESNAVTIQQHAEKLDAHAEELAAMDAVVSDNQTRIATSEIAIAENAGAISQLQTDFEQLDLTVSSLSYQLAQTQDQVDANTAGIAIANALAGSTWLQSNERFAFSANWGHYEGHDAVAFSGAARLGRHLSANAALGALPDRGEVGARAGLRMGW